MAYDVRNADYLGRGGFGQVYGIDDKTAIKRVFLEDEQKKKQVIDEIIFMLKIKQ